MTINTINNHKYIGQHTKFNDTYLGSGIILNRAIKKYGKENFKRIILAYAKTAEELNQLERQYIKENNAVESKEFYNIHIGGSGGDTFSGKSEEEKIEFRRKMSQITKGKNNGMYNKKQSDSTKEKIRLKRKNNNAIYCSEEFKRKISLVTSGENNGMFNHRHSEDSKRLMSEHSKGKTSGSRNGMYNKINDSAINGKKVYQYKDEDHKEQINVFNTVTCALKYLNVKGHNSLYKAIKLNKKYKDYYWSKELKV